MENLECRHCGSRMESGDLVDLAVPYLLIGSIRDKLPLKEPKPRYLQLLRCPRCGYTEVFFSD